MEIDGQSRRHSAIPVIAIGFRVGLGIGLSMLAVLSVIVGGSIAVGHRNLLDPFASVSDLFEGDVRQVALTRGFTCANPDYAASLSDFCTQLDTDQTYSDIRLHISGNVAQEVDLLLQENTLTLGDLVLLWGEPVTHLYCESEDVSWSIHHLAVMVSVPRAKRYNYFAPIIQVSFLRKGHPYWEQPLYMDMLHGCYSN